MLDGKARLTRKRVAALILLIVTLVPLSLAAAGSASGNQQKMISSADQKLTTFIAPALTAPPITLWTYETPEGIVPAGSSPVVADLYGNGKNEVLVWMANGSAAMDIATQWRQHILYCLNGTTGTALWNYTILGGGVVADLCGDSKLEVLVGSGGFNPLDPKYTKIPAIIICLNGTSGSEVWNYTTTYDDNFYSLAVADVNGDGKKEVLATSYDSTFCLDGTTGAKLWSYATGCVYSSPVVADLFGDGKIEVLVAAWDIVYCLDGATGNLLWNSATGYNDYSPTVADLFGDGKLEVLVGSRDGGVYCFDGTTGYRLWTFTAEIGPSEVSYRNDITSSPLATDLDGDGKKEVLVGSMNYNVYCLDGTTGNTVWSYTTGGVVPCSPVAADIAADLFGDGKKEVLAGSQDGNVYCFDGLTGIKLWNCMTGAVYTSPVVVDVSGCGTLVMVGAHSAVAGLYCIDGANGNMVLMYGTDGTLTSPPVVADVFGNGEKEILIGVSFASGLGALGRSCAPSGSGSGAIYCIALPTWTSTGTPRPTLDSRTLIALAIVGTGVSGAAVLLVVFVKHNKSKKGL